MWHKGVPAQGMLKDRLGMPRYHSHWQWACTIAMAKAGWVQHQSQHQSKHMPPEHFLNQPGSIHMGFPQQEPAILNHKMGWLVLPIVLWRH